MAMQYEALFEAPASHEAQPYNNPYSNPEFENEWEASNPYSNPEFENEWESSNPYSNLEFENEWELSGHASYNTPYANPEFEDEWETSDPYGSLELEDEGEYEAKRKRRRRRSKGGGGGGFWDKIVNMGKRVAQAALPIAGTVAGSFLGPVGGALGGAAGSGLAKALSEGEMEAQQMEMEFFGNNEMEAEVSNSEVAHEAALTEFLAAQAAESTLEGEAEAAIGAALTTTVDIMGGKRALRPVMPTLTQATGKLTKMLRQQGPAGKQLLRTVPTIQRQAVATLKAAARAGQPINSATAVKAMAAATNRVLSNPQTVQKAVVRNAVLRQRTAPPNPRRRGASGAATQCPTCAAPMQ